jgi:hypothetical protein
MKAFVGVFIVLPRGTLPIMLATIFIPLISSPLLIALTAVYDTKDLRK